jgi:hypothetical protein
MIAWLPWGDDLAYCRMLERIEWKARLHMPHGAGSYDRGFSCGFHALKIGIVKEFRHFLSENPSCLQTEK